MYAPGEHEAERASNSYLMSLAAALVGLPMPIVNLAATIFFAVANRRSTPFVRWHCTQALLGQLFLFPINAFAMWQTINVVVGDAEATDFYIGYLLTAIIWNLADTVATIYASVQTRKGHHVRWFFFAELADLLSPAYLYATAGPATSLNPFDRRP